MCGFLGLVGLGLVDGAVLAHGAVRLLHVVLAGGIVVAGAVHVLLEDRLLLVDIELGLELLLVRVDARAVGAAARVGEVEVLVDYFLAGLAPGGGGWVSWWVMVWWIGEGGLKRQE